MARFKEARWRGPVPNQNPGQMVRPLSGLVVHIQQGHENGTDAHFKNPASKVSAHFGNPKTGGLDQWVDTDDKAWAVVAGNRRWISVENEGFSGDSLTDSQIENCAKLLLWLHETENIPLQITNDPNGRGLGYHAMGGAAWGGHADCPGQRIIDQRPKIIARAQALTVEAVANEPALQPFAAKASAVAAAAGAATATAPQP